MKKLVIIAALVASPAFADTWEMPNKSGGKIVLEETVCIASNGKRYESLKNMFAVSGEGRSYTGCWYYADGWVHVVYNDKTEYKYPADAFQLIKSGYRGNKI